MWEIKLLFKNIISSVASLKVFIVLTILSSTILLFYISLFSLNDELEGDIGAFYSANFAYSFSKKDMLYLNDIEEVSEVIKTTTCFEENFLYEIILNGNKTEQNIPKFRQISFSDYPQAVFREAKAKKIKNVLYGRMPLNNEEVVLPPNIAATLTNDDYKNLIGKKISFNSLDGVDRSYLKNLTICGVFSQESMKIEFIKWYGMSNALLFYDLKEIDEDKEFTYNRWYIYLKDYKSIDDVIAIARENNDYVTNDILIDDYTDAFAEVESLTSILKLTIIIFGSVILCTILLGVFLSIKGLMYERERQQSLLLMLGASKTCRSFVFMLEILALAFISSIASYCLSKHLLHNLSESIKIEHGIIITFSRIKDIGNIALIFSIYYIVILTVSFLVRMQIEKGKQIL